MKKHYLPVTFLAMLPLLSPVFAQEATTVKDAQGNSGAIEETTSKRTISSIKEKVKKMSERQKTILYRWDLNEVYRLALEKNPSLQASALRVQAAAYAVEEARSSYYPTVDLNAGYSYSNVESGRGYIGHDGTSAGVSAAWVLFSGFERKFANKIAEYAHITTVDAHLDGQRLLLEAVSTAFYNAALAQENMRIAKEDADFNELMLEEANVRKEAGVVDNSYVWNYEIKCGQALASYIDAQKSWQVACIALAQLLALENKEIADSVELKVPENTKEYKQPKLAEELIYAINNRPDVRSSAVAIEQAQATMDKEKTRNLPTLTASMNYSWTRDDSYYYDKGNQNLSAALVAKWNLFSGGGISSAIKRNAANMIAAQNDHENKILAVDSEIHNVFRVLNASREQIVIQQEIYDLSLKLRDYVKIQLYHGATTVTRLNEVQTDLVNAAASLSSAKIRYLQNLETVKVVSGRIIEEHISSRD